MEKTITISACDICGRKIAGKKVPDYIAQRVALFVACGGMEFLKSVKYHDRVSGGFFIAEWI